MTDLFSASCAPGATAGSKLCQQCAGNIDSKDEKVVEATKCKATEAEAFYGGKGALKYVNIHFSVLYCVVVCSFFVFFLLDASSPTKETLLLCHLRT